jgi:cysteine-S-conjugate beta-lyase
MEEEVVYDFDTVVSRAGTHAEKYDARLKYFGDAEVEPFWVADMDLPAPPFLVEALQGRLAHPMFGYTEQYEAVFSAIAWWMADQHGVRVEREWMLLSPSVVTSISMAVQALTKPGEGVAVLSPVYGPFFSCAQQNGRKVVDCPLVVEQGRYAIDFEVLERAFATEEVRLLMLCNPHNPGGRVWTEAELTALTRLCEKYDVLIFSDEIHCDIVYPPHRHHSMLKLVAASDRLIVAHSIGKTFNTSGLQASFVMIPDEALRGRFSDALRCAHVGDLNLLGKVAIATVLSPAGADYKRQLIAYLEENIRLVCERLRRLERATVMEPEATFLVWFDLRAYGDWPEMMRRLVDEARVAFSGGTFFGPAGRGWFRINCAHPRAKLLAAVDRVVAMLEDA